MNKTITRWAALAAATVVGAAVLAPLGAGVAQAAGGTQTEFYTAVASGDTHPSLWKAPGTRLSPAGVNVKEMRGSRDGTRFVTIEIYINSGGSQVQSVVVYDVGGRKLTTVETVPSSKNDLLFPVLSPDGNTVAWNRGTHGTPGAVLVVKNLATGAVKTINNTIGATLMPVFLTGSTLLVRDGDLRGYSLPIGGGTPTYIPSLPSKAIDVVVSPSGKTVAWEDEYYGSPVTAEIAVASLNTSGGISFGTPVVSTVGEDNFVPSFSRDGSQVYFVHSNGAGGPGDLRRLTVTYTNGVPTAVGGVEQLTVSTGPVVYHAVGEIPAAPASGSLATPVPAAALLAGTSATVNWTVTGSGLSFVFVERFLGSVRQKYAWAYAPATSFRDTGLVVGKTYQYRFTSYDRAGRKSGVATRNLIATTSLPSASDPTSNATTKAPFIVRFGTAPTTAKWTVDYRVNSGSTWTRWLTDATGSSTRTFTAALVGRTYQFRAKARYSNGDSTPLVYSARTVVPFNQTSASLSGGTNVSSAYAWLGSYRKLTRTSNYAKFTVTGNRLQVIAWRCSGCGSFALYENGVRIATVSTYSSSTKARSVVYTRTYSTNVTKSFAIKPLGTAGHPAILLDGFAMRR